ncbi:major facilitator superfamily domain-containing protein [Lophiotrema nucula]|uniref:Major facilitator superfamily domain-containing protein n=1 Tax=Lophiotrema nucula TaxID=690887 RepID=A0A6A5Z8W4_9PLEO|nr:major facilitator superfamily domain-containing protein [Lophiotrema nucula]
MADEPTNTADTSPATVEDKDIPHTSAIQVEESIDPENEIVGARLILIHIGTTIATFLAGLDSNLIATSVPVITSQFNSIGDVGWYGASFYIAMCASQPLAGKIYTLFSKKLTFLFYLFIFELGNLVCALSPSSTALIAGRAVTGLGASGVFVGGIVILATIIPLHKRAIWQGTQVSLFSLASVVGPIIGGALTQSVTWRWCFWINLPFGAIAAVLLLFLNIRKPEAATHWPLVRKIKALDFIGFILLAGSAIMLLLALQLGGTTYSWNSSVVIGLFVGFAVTIIPFICWQVFRGDDALVPPRLFGYRNASLLCLCQMFAAGPFQVIVYWLPIWFQAVLGVSPIASGIRYLPTVIADALTCIVGSAIIMQLGIWNPFLLLSKVLISLSGGLLSTIHLGISSSHLIGYQILGGIGFGLVNNVAHIGMQASVPKELVPIGASSLMSIVSATCAVYLAAGQTIFQDRLKANLSGKVSSELIERLLDLGATNIRSFISLADLPVVLEGYSKSITQVFYLPAAAPVIGFFIALGLKWTSLKKKEATQGAAGEADSESNVGTKVQVARGLSEN